MPGKEQSGVSEKATRRIIRVKHNFFGTQNSSLANKNETGEVIKETGYRPDFDPRERNLSLLKTKLYNQFVISPENIPESYWKNQQRIRRERGQGAERDWETVKQQNTEAIIEDQRASIDRWVDYLSSPEALYAPDVKDFVLENILSLGNYDKAKRVFYKRSQGTIKPFPELNPEALGIVLDIIEKVQGEEYIRLENQITAAKEGLQRKLHASTNSVESSYLEAAQSRIRDLEEEQVKIIVGERNYSEVDLPRLVTGANQRNFARLYALEIERTTLNLSESYSQTEGGWAFFPENSDPMTFIPEIVIGQKKYLGHTLLRSIQGKGTGWCTAGESTAKEQLKMGSFYVYYTLDTNGNPTVPRLAIRQVGLELAEVRGVAPEQNIETGMEPIVEEKLKEFTDGDEYNKKIADMKRLTAIENKTKKGVPLNASDLIFVYEARIQGFGYFPDPRIEAVKKPENLYKDMATIFACNQDQIAYSPSEIGPYTKAYVGDLFPGIFDWLKDAHIEHVYTSFPKGKIRRQSLITGGQTKEDLKSDIIRTKVSVEGTTNYMIESPEFTPSNNKQIEQIVRLTRGSLNIHSSFPTTDQIYEKARILGLELCPPEVALNYMLQYPEQLNAEAVYIAMLPIYDIDGIPHIFDISRDKKRLQLQNTRVDKNYWLSGDEFIFILPKKTETLSVSGEAK